MKFRENNVNTNKKSIKQIYWLLTLTLSFIIVLGVIYSISMMSQTYEVQRFYRRNNGFGNTIILYNNGYFTFESCAEDQYVRYNNGKWKLFGDTIILDLIWKDKFGTDTLFENAKYLIKKDSIVLSNVTPFSYEVFYPYNHSWDYDLHEFWRIKTYYYENWRINY